VSWQAVEAVREHSRATHSARLIALCLASHAHADGSNAFLSITTLQREAKLANRSTVVNGLRRLRELGEVEQTDTRPSGTPVYKLTLPIEGSSKTGPAASPENELPTYLGGPLSAPTSPIGDGAGPVLDGIGPVSGPEPLEVVTESSRNLKEGALSISDGEQGLEELRSYVAELRAASEGRWGGLLEGQLVEAEQRLEDAEVIDLETRRWTNRVERQAVAA
jgi:hypothetical protein